MEKVDEFKSKCDYEGGESLFEIRDLGEKADKFLDIEELAIFPELPFCILVTPSQQKELVLRSITTQAYANRQII